MSNFNKTNIGDMMKRYDKAKDWYELKDAWRDLDIEIQREIERSYPDMSDQKIREYSDKIVTDMGYNPYKS